MPLKPLIDLDIVIPSYNRQVELHQTLEMILNQVLLPRKVIVVDQTRICGEPGSDLVNAYARVGVGLSWIHRQKPNLCGARNTGIAASEAKICLFLDDDVLLPPTLVKDHWLRYQAPNCPAAIGGQVYHRQPSFPIDSLSIRDPRRGTSPAFSSSRPIRRGPLFGGHFSVERAAVYCIGGWDEAFVGSANWEEGDFMHRLDSSSYEYVWDPTIWLIHYRSPSGGCRIPGNSSFPEWTKTANFFLLGFRYPTDKSKSQIWRTALRSGPLRKEVVHCPRLWLSAWFAVVQGWNEARYRAKHPILPLRNSVTTTK